MNKHSNNPYRRLIITTSRFFYWKRNKHRSAYHFNLIKPSSHTNFPTLFPVFLHRGKPDGNPLLPFHSSERQNGHRGRPGPGLLSGLYPGVKGASFYPSGIYGTTGHNEPAVFSFTNRKNAPLSYIASERTCLFNLTIGE